MYTNKLITSRKYFKMAAKSGFLNTKKSRGQKSHVIKICDGQHDNDDHDRNTCKDYIIPISLNLRESTAPQITNAQISMFMLMVKISTNNQLQTFDDESDDTTM